MGIVQTITAGGQTWMHRIRMLRQVLKISTGVSTASSVTYWLFQMSILPNIYYTALIFYMKAKVSGYFTDSVYVNREFWAKASNIYLSKDRLNVSIDSVERVTLPYVKKVLSFGFQNVQNASDIFFYSMIVTLIFFLFRGMATKRKNHISGQRIRSSLYIRWIMKLRNKASDIKIGKIPLLKSSETMHVMITGGTGSGKTNCLHHLLKQIRERGDKAVVVDTTGAFIDRYFDRKKDYLLNPFHNDSEKWSPWAECSDKFDYDALAESIIPQSFSDHENYWRTSSRTVLSALLEKLSDSKKTSELVSWLLYKPLSDLCQIVEGTKAAAHMDIQSEKTAASVRSVISSFLSSLEYIKDTEEPFSVKKWIEEESSKSGWLFLHALPSQRSSLNPLIASWVSIAVRKLINLKPSSTRRVWFILDELASLNKIKDLETLITEGRKYGGCAVLSLQSPSQLEAIYGRSIASTILGNSSTKIVFSEKDPQIASQISKSFGEREVMEYSEGLSYGAHEVRDGVSLSSSKKMVPVISPSKIQSLKSNRAYLLLPGNLPIAKIKLPISRI